MSYTCLIVDDEQPARVLLENYVKKLPQLQLKGACKSAMEGIEVLNREKIDLLFLDIQMPDLTGLDMLKSLRNRPLTIFTTAYQEYALDGYELDVVDYLLKPFTFARFTQAVNKSVELLELRSGERPIQSLSNSQETQDTIIIKAEHKIHKIKLSDIRYIEGLREYVTYHLTEGKIIVLESLKSIEEKFGSAGFLRVHKSFIVNKAYVQMMEGNRLHMGDQKIPVGASYKDFVVKQIFGD